MEVPGVGDSEKLPRDKKQSRNEKAADKDIHPMRANPVILINFELVRSAERTESSMHC